MPRVKHRRVTRDYVIVRLNLPDPNTKQILVVETDMPLSDSDPGFDQDDFNSLVQAVRAAIEDRSSIDAAEITTV